MKDRIENLSYAELVDKIADYTALYTELIHKKGNKELIEKCLGTLQYLQERANSLKEYKPANDTLAKKN